MRRGPGLLSVSLNASSAIVTYEVSFTERSADGKHLGGRTDHALTAWAMRDGKWWAVFSESKRLKEAGRPSGVYRLRFSDELPIEYRW
jgi:hypothetical protein